MSKPLPFDDYDDDVSDDDIVYEPLDDVAWVDEEDLDAIEVTEDDVVEIDEAAEAGVADEVTAPGALDAGAEAGTPAPASLAPEAAPTALPLFPEESPALERAPDSVQEPASPPCLFRVVVPLSDELRDAIEIARGTHALDVAPPDTLELIAPFRCDDDAALEDALEEWAVERLPIHLTLSEVTAEVVGAQRYLAGWLLTPPGRLAAAQQALKRALADLIEPCADAPDAFEPRVIVADRVAPTIFPHLIAEMQRLFETQAWAIEEIALEEASSGDRTSRWIPRLSLP